MDIVKIKFFGAKEGKGFFHSDDHKKFGGGDLKKFRGPLIETLEAKHLERCSFSVEGGSDTFSWDIFSYSSSLSC